MVRALVLDASVALKAILPNPLQENCRELVKTFVEVQPVAPSLWAYETTSAIAKLVHFQQLTQEQARSAINQLESLNVQLVTPNAELNLAAFDWTIRLNRAAAYDSYYLALAQTLNCPLWTADKRLFNALSDNRPDWLHWIEELVM